jgi:hypothetical protein
LVGGGQTQREGNRGPEGNSEGVGEVFREGAET